MTATRPPEADAAPLSEERAALADLARRGRFLDTLALSLAEQRCVKLVLGKPRRAGSDLASLPPMARKVGAQQRGWQLGSGWRCH